MKFRLFPEKKEDRPTPKEVYNFRTYLVASIASAGAATIGYDSAFIGGTIALDSFRNEFNFDKLPQSDVDFLRANIVSTYQGGAFFGAFLAYLGGHFLGRRMGLILFGLIFMVGAGIMLSINADRGLGALYAGRVIAGLAIGGMSNLIPIYIAEMSPPAIRGRLVGMWEVGWQSGGLVGFWINYAVNRTLEPSHKQWLIPFAVQLIPAGFLLIGAIVTNESPRWLMTNGKREKGIQVLSQLRNLSPDHPYLAEEIAQIDQAIDIQATTIGLGFNAPFEEVRRNKSVQWRLFLACSLFFWQNGSGINAINYYSPIVFQSIGIQGTNAPLLSTGIFGVVKTVMTVVWILWMIDYFGRRNLLLWGAAGGSVSLWIVGAIVGSIRPDPDTNSADTPAGRAAIAFFYIWTIFYTPSWSGTPWNVSSEIFDQNMRSLGQACAAASNWFWNFLVARFTPQMFTSMGFGVFLFFASLQLLSIFYVYFLLPETGGVPLEQMDLLFSKGLAPRHAHKEVMSRLQSADEEGRRVAMVQENMLTKQNQDSASHVEKALQ